MHRLRLGYGEFQVQPEAPAREETKLQKGKKALATRTEATAADNNGSLSPRQSLAPWGIV
ncbi:hypothetical protein [Paenibacillus harenae]|uniref:hypothetical protein n=1 Tax=Paenibacillus harenae TaxID=306543 RepID=UPI0004181213|nr:hypothetical protein [Paenibacillus harenae]